MKTLLSFLCLCSFFSTLYGGEKIKFTAYYQVFLPPSDQPGPYPVEVHHFDIWINIKNEGIENLVIPTAGFTTQEFLDQKELKINLLFETAKSVVGEKVKDSDSRYSLVTLKPGEIAEIKFSTGPTQTKVSKLHVTYKVQADYAKMHGSWDGEVAADATDVIAMYMPPQKESERK